MGARREGLGALAPSCNLKKITSYAAFLRNALKCSLALSALAINTLKFSLKCRKRHKNFRLRPRRPEKWSIFSSTRRKTVNFYRCCVFCPLLKIFCGAHDGSRFCNQWDTDESVTLNNYRVYQTVCYDVVAFSDQLETCDSVTHIVHGDQEPPWL